MQAHYPEQRLSAADIAGSFAGVRPILYTHSDNPSEASREEDIWEESGMLSVAGGKLTTWRQTAEETVDAALKLLPEERTRSVAPCYTGGTPLVDLAPQDLEQRLRINYALPSAVAAGMARRLRSTAWWAPRLAHHPARWKRRLHGLAWLAPRLARNENELNPLIDGTDLSAAEARAHCAFGAVLHVEDLLLRRVRIGLWQPALAREIVPRLRPIFRQELGWDDRRWEKEAESFDKALLGWTLQGVQ